MATAPQKNRPTSSTPSSAAPKQGFLGRLLAPPAAATGAKAGSGTAPQRTGTTRLLFGFLAFMVGAQIIQFGLAYLDVQFKWNLQRLTLAPANTPVLGGLNAFFVVSLVLAVLLLVLLYRTGIMPRDALGTRARAEQMRTQNAARTPGTGRGASTMTRSQRRQAAAQRAEADAAKAKGGKGAKAAPVPAEPVATTAEVRPYDDAYAQAQAEQRRRRRAAKR